MITVIVPTLDAEAGLSATLTALVPAAIEGLVREVIVADGGSGDHTAALAEDAGAVVIRTPAGRGGQLRAGAARARWPWLLFMPGSGGRYQRAQHPASRDRRPNRPS